ncbi:fork head domain protein, putative [Plasmodium knowlesi strain H]|uniref:Fork head domain protein, putative n=3 Tax=Plasmodium knowlesi TaxID=5850 RepID=A0A5E7X605_PLAKH|nr:FHA domain-containing protein, putative [Plasmodium knowlesi strain H]OTN64065.1 putative Fork head domain protein [Plasmodium knowlesi]CAA9990680.1 FHA domain-containing protein, putative [Plasmodium knowlesi strain H]SBO25934.1 fork head domain protein, putative [Plasmodium knowlesi strain H]SBO28678.1 fork head domain protein, putative [Plasmodium knowlesi strain H]VVS80154.1 FHA domain-containing protein, putative [Plasmodium knowlesi strain H]
MDGKTVECKQYAVHAKGSGRGRSGSASPSRDTRGRSSQYRCSRSGRSRRSSSQYRRSKGSQCRRSRSSQYRRSRSSQYRCSRSGRSRRPEHRRQKKEMTYHGKRKTRADERERMQKENGGNKREHSSKRLKGKNRSRSRSSTNEEEPAWERKKKLYYEKEKNKMSRESRDPDRRGFSSYDKSKERVKGRHNEYDNRHRRHREDKQRRGNNMDKDQMHSYDHEGRDKSSENVHVKKDQQEDGAEEEEKNKNEPKEEKNFNPSGLLAQEKNYKNGVELKYIESIDAELPDKKWRLYVFLNANTKDPAEILHLHRKSCYLIGKDDLVVDIKLANPTISKQHAVIQFKKHGSEVLPFLLDLKSTNGSYLNNDLIEPNKFYELRQTDILRFGSSAREYVLLHDSSDNPSHA